METHQSATSDEPSPKAAFLSLAGVCIAILAYSYVVPGDASEGLAYLVGYKLPIALVIWGLYRWLLGKSLSKPGSLIAFILVHASLVAGAYVSAQKQRAEATEMISRIQTDYKSLTQASTGSDGLPQKIDTPISAAPVSTGELGEMERLIRQLMVDMVTQRNEYFAELESAGWTKMLDSTRITRDTDLRETQKIVATARALVDKYDSKSKALIDAIPAKINALNVQESSKRDMIRGFEKTAGQSRTQLVELWALERQTLVEVEGAVLVLGSSRGKWTFKDDNFVFADQRSLDSFNARMSAVQELTRQQTDLQKRNSDKALANMERLKQ